MTILLKQLTLLPRVPVYAAYHNLFSLFQLVFTVQTWRECRENSIVLELDSAFQVHTPLLIDSIALAY